MAGRGEAAHVAADLREDRQRRQPADPGDRHKQPDQVAKPGLGLDPLVKAPEPASASRSIILTASSSASYVVLTQMKLQQEAMMR